MENISKYTELKQMNSGEDVAETERFAKMISDNDVAEIERFTKMKNRIPVHRRIGLFSIVFIVVFMISIGEIYCHYLKQIRIENDRINLICDTYSRQNTIFDECTNIGYRGDFGSFYYYTFSPNNGYMPFDALDMYRLQYFANKYTYENQIEISIPAVEDFYEQRISPKSLLANLENVDSSTKEFIEYITDYKILSRRFDDMYDKGSYYCLLDAKCQEMYGVGLFDVAVEGEGDSSKIGNFDLWDYVLTMDQMNAAAQSLLLEKDSVS